MRLREFYNRVTEGLALGELWVQFKSDAHSSYRLYSHEVDWETLQRLPFFRRTARIAGALFWAMLMLLSPARRVLLLLSLGCLLLGSVGAVENRPRFSLFGSLGMLILVALELADRVVMKRDLKIARDIQRWLVPEVPPHSEKFDIAFSTRPANTVGGDYYDVIATGLQGQEGPPARLLLVVADVAGKSVPAALLMATFHASLKTLVSRNPPLLELATGLNDFACTESQQGKRFTTAFLAELDCEDGSLKFVNAGHNYPILRHADGRVERLQKGGLPFGIRPRTPYQVGVASLAQDDLLIIFTDGVVEAVNEEGAEFGEARLLGLVQSLSLNDADTCLKELIDSVERFVGTARQHDDMTWLLVRSR